MNVLQIVNMASVYSGNLMQSIWSLEEEIEKQGNCVYLFPSEARERDWILNMQKRGKTVYFKEGQTRQDQRLIVEICAKHGIDMIHLHFWNIPDCMAIKRVLRAGRNVQSVIHHHSMYCVSRKRLNEHIKKWILKGNHHIACSEGMYHALLSAGFSESEVYCVNNCVDFSRLDHRAPMNWEGNTVLMFSSCGSKIKGIDIACKAIRELVAEGTEMKLLIVCSERQDDVERFIREILQIQGNLPDWIQFLPPRNDIATYYSDATIFLSASRSEGLCYAVIEAVYCDCETIQSQIPGHRLDIPECKTFESENVEQLKMRIMETLAEEAEESARIHKLQREYVIGEYGIKKWVDGVMSVYKKVRGE